jgi:hypothetical protein
VPAIARSARLASPARFALAVAILALAAIAAAMTRRP